MSNTLLKSFLPVLILIISTFGLGFYLGTKYVAYKKAEDSTDQIIQQALENVNSSSSSSSSPVNAINLATTSNPDIFWIKTGTKPECPQTHPVKGKFDSNANVFYLPDNKSYNRVRPDICFASKEFAEIQAGFLVKY